MWRRAQVEVAIFEAQVFVDLRIVERERRHVGFVEHAQFARDHFDPARGELGVLRAREARDDFAGDLDHVLAAQSVRSFGDLRMFLGTKDDLRQTFAIAQVDEDDAAMVAPRIHPAGERDGLVDVGFTELVAVMGAIHK